MSFSGSYAPDYSGNYLGNIGSANYWRKPKDDGGWDYYKQGFYSSSPFSLSEADAMRELGVSSFSATSTAPTAPTAPTTNYYVSSAPKMPEYKPMNYSWEQAKAEAAPSVNTYYDKTLNDYLKTVETRKTRTNEDLATSMANYGTQEKYLGEDYATTLANLATGAKFSGQQEAITGTANRGAAQSALAGAGLTFSGIGQEKLNQQDVARRLSLAAATAQLDQAKGAAETTKVRGVEAIGTGKKAVTTKQQRELEDIATEQEAKKTELEYQRSADIAEKASQLYQQQEAAWRTANPEWASYFG